jgi:hypothetical protein
MDMWNVGYSILLGGKDAAAMKKACKDVERDPDTLAFTYNVSLAYPDLLGWKKDKKRGTLSGSVEEIAEAFMEYEARGTAELMFHITPATPQAYERLAGAAELYRQRR